MLLRERFNDFVIESEFKFLKNYLRAYPNECKNGLYLKALRPKVLAIYKIIKTAVRPFLTSEYGDQKTQLKFELLNPKF